VDGEVFLKQAKVIWGWCSTCF